MWSKYNQGQRWSSQMLPYCISAASADEHIYIYFHAGIFIFCSFH